MRVGSLALGVVAAAVAAAGCQDPEIAIVLRFPDEVPGDEERVLADAVEELEVSVFQFAASDCDDLTYGRVSLDVQDDSRRSRVVLSRTSAGFRGRLDGIPRLADSVIAVRGRDATGQLIAGGCVDLLGETTDDREIAIDVARTLIVRVLPSDLMAPSLRLPVEDGGVVAVVARYRGLSSPVPVSALRVRLRALPTDDESAPAGWTIEAPSTPETEAAGIFTIGGLDTRLQAVGPVEVVVRGAWADQVTRISAGVRPVATARFAMSELADGPNAIPATWAVLELPATSTRPARVVAVGRFLGASDDPKLVVVREADGGVLSHATLPMLGVRSLTTFRNAARMQRIVGRNATGWVIVNWAADPPATVTVPEPSTPGPVDQLLGVPPCGDPPSVTPPGVLGVAGGAVVAWDELAGAPPVTTGPLAALGANLGALTASGGAIELLGATCGVVRVDAAEADVSQPVVAARVTTLGRAAIYLVTPERPAIPTPFEGGVAALTIGGHPSLLAVTVGAAGPRVGSYRLRYDDPAVPDAPPPLLIPDLVIDHPLATPATEVVALRGIGDAFDTLALHALPGALGLSMTRGSVPAGHELSAMTVIEGLGTGQRLRRVGYEENGDGRPGRAEIMVSGDQGLAIYDVAPKTMMKEAP